MGFATSGYQYSVIQEEVSSKDIFPHRTHDSIKESLFQLITTSSSSFTIGLEGQWGTGKSTVIHLLEEAFNKDINNKTLFFTFDAWAHEGDPLRRVFLETLISSITKNSFLDHLLKEITGQKKVVEVKTLKQTSRFADCLALFTLFVPIGAAILSAINYDKVYAPWSALAYKVHYPFILGLALSLAPLFLILYWSAFGEKSENGERDWSLLASNSTENYTQSITEEGEKSSVEFEGFFSKILNYVLGKDKAYDRVVIVVDNLDRVEAEHARQLWSTLQPFFLNNTKLKNSNWQNKVWFIVPYDREGLSKIWGSKLEINKEQTSEISQSFFSKCFQVVAEVPSPVFSGWCDYLSSVVPQSLALWPSSERQEVIDTFKRFASRLEISPTPRQINNFINQVGFIGIRWGGAVSGEAMALYALFRTKYTESQFRRQLLDSQEVPEAIETINDPLEIKQELAGLLFGVPKNTGFELLLKPEINKAIVNGDSSKFRGLVQTHNEAFWITWTAVKAEFIPTFTHSEEFRISATKAVYEVLSEKEMISKVKKEFAQFEMVWKQSENNWRFDNKLDYFGGLKLICDHSFNAQELISWLNQIVLKKLEDFIGKVGAEELNLDEFNQLRLLSDYLDSKGNPLKRFHYNRLNEQNWKIWLTFLQDNDSSMKSVLPVQGAIQSLGDLNIDFDFDATLIFEQLIQTYEIIPNSKEWASVLSSIITWLTSPSAEMESNLVFEFMLMLLKNSQYKKTFKTAQGIDQVWSHGVVESTNDLSYFAVFSGAVLGADLQKNNDLISGAKEYWSSETNSSEKVKFVFDLLDRTGNLNVLWDLLEDKNNKLALEVLKANLHNDELCSSSYPLLNLKNYRWVGDSELENFIQHFSRGGAFDAAKEQLEKKAELFDFPLFKLQEYGEKSVKDFVNDIIKALSKDAWIEAFESNSWLLNCVFDKDIKLDHKYKDAFEVYFLSTFEKLDDSEWQWDYFEELLEKVIDKSKVLKSLTIKYFECEVDNLRDSSFNCLSKKIHSQLKSVKPQRIMERLSKWIDAKATERIVWLAETGKIFSGSPDESLETRLIELRDKNEADISPDTIVKLSKMFSIDLD